MNFNKEYPGSGGSTPVQDEDYESGGSTQGTPVRDESPGPASPAPLAADEDDYVSDGGVVEREVEHQDMEEDADEEERDDDEREMHYNYQVDSNSQNGPGSPSACSPVASPGTPNSQSQDWGAEGEGPQSPSGNPASPGPENHSRTPSPGNSQPQRPAYSSRSRSPSPIESRSPAGSNCDSPSRPPASPLESGPASPSADVCNKSGSPSPARSLHSGSHSPLRPPASPIDSTQGSPRISRSHSVSPDRREGSASPAGGRSGSQSPVRSRSGSPAYSLRSGSVSPARSQRSGSKTPSRRSRSGSGSPAKQNRRSGSRDSVRSSASPAGSHRSKSPSPAGSHRSRSPSPARSHRSRSVSPTVSQRSRSASPAGSHRSRSGSAGHSGNGSPARSRSNSGSRMGSASPARSRSGSRSRSWSGSPMSHSRSRSRSASPASNASSGSGILRHKRKRIIADDDSDKENDDDKSVRDGSDDEGKGDSDADAGKGKGKKAGKGSDDDDDSDKESVADELIADIFGSSDEEEEFAGFNAEEIAKRKERKEKKKSSTLLSDDEGLAEGLSHEGEGSGEVLPTMSDDENDEAVRKDDKDGKEFVSDFDLMMMKKKEEMKKCRRKRKDADMINDNDDLIAEMITKMKEAAEEDRHLNSRRQPATRKLRLLPFVISQLKKSDLHLIFLESGILSALTEWLAPLPDKSLPHFNIRESLLRILSEFPVISSESLKSSGIGKAVMYLYKHPKELRENRERAGKLINEWSRPIFNLTSDFKNMSREERQQRDYEQEPKRRRTSEGGQTPRQNIDNALQGEQRALRPGDPGWIYRARVPMPSNKDYVHRPTSSIEAAPVKGASKKKITRYDKHVRNFKEKKKYIKGQRAVQISIEGRNMAL